MIERQLHEIETLQAKYDIGAKVRTALTQLVTRKGTKRGSHVETSEIGRKERSQDSIKTEIETSEIKSSNSNTSRARAKPVTMDIGRENDAQLK